MSFVVTENPTFTHDVKVKVPVDGGFETQTLKVTYRVVDQEEFDSFDFERADSSTNFLRTAIVGLDDIVDAEGKSLPYNDKLRDRLINVPYVRVAFVTGYMNAISEARLGN